MKLYIEHDVSHTTNILYGFTDQTFFHKCAKTEPNAIHSSNVTAKYVLETYAHQIWHICQIFDRLNGRCIHRYVLSIKSLQSTK